MHVIVCIFVCEFHNEILLKGEEYKTRKKKSNSQMMKQTAS